MSRRTDNRPAHNSASVYSQSGQPDIHVATSPYLEYEPKGVFHRQGTFISPVLARERGKLGYSPLSLVLIILWVVYICCMLYILEAAVEKGKTDPSLPWVYSDAPRVLLTVFAQVHASITGMHLARIALSSLGFARTSPNRWLDFFWTADGAWQSPVGILTSFYSSVHRKIRPSVMFCMFALTCIVAMATPTLLNNAFPIINVALPVSATIRPTTFDSTAMTFFDAYLQQSVGMGSWGTGLPMSQLFSTSVFLPPGNASQSNTTQEGDPADFFFAGSVGGVTVELPGIRLEGGCAAVDGSNDLGLLDAGLGLADLLRDSCTGIGADFVASGAVVGILDLVVEYALCSALGFSGLREDPTGNEGYFMYTYNTTSGTSPPGRGIVHCTSLFTTGNAHLDGGNRSVTQFAYQKLFDAGQSSHGGEPLSDPMGAAWNYLGTSESWTTAEKESVIRGFGWRKTFASSLDTYVAAEFVAKYKPELFEHMSLGKLDDNPNVDDRFSILRN
ncbi:hypothetical protein EXIGLDRAFT_694540 [Exidia glandulosa HHB12029]|uniref:Uncharacterized protein n=1 Tax=Exidia glandulosa HHB12029 TaxID=1314781 RepID=A0A165GJD4_EXIGL|nr:hypothetical protein EXIGLDRAFT_694540 [Exidia glandulosa HHB12029]